MKERINWRKEAESIQDNENIDVKVFDIYFATLNYILKNDWKGSCHITTAIMYILLKESGFSPICCIGEVVASESLAFDHSWIELDGEIYDASIVLPLEEIVVSGPIFNSIDIIDCSFIDEIYGIKHTGLGPQAKRVQRTNFVQYIQPMYCHLEKIAMSARVHIDRSILTKFENTQWVLKSN